MRRLGLLFSQAKAWARRVTVLKDSGTLNLRVGDATLTAEARHSGGITWSGAASYDSLDDLADAIARLAAEPARPCRRLAVTLEPPVVQLRTLDGLPPVKPTALAALVAHQAGRFFRKNGAPLVTDSVWVNRNTPGRKDATPPRGIARGAAVEERVLEAIATGARAAGLIVETISPANEPARLLLLPTSERTVRARAAQLLARRLVIATLATWFLAAGLFLGRLTWDRRAVTADLAALREPLDAVVTARRELRDAGAIVGAVRQAEEQRGRVTALLGALSRALPDSVVLTAIAWRADGSGVVTGAARRAGEVLARLERARLFDAPHFEGPIVREAIAGRDWERFTIVFGARDSGLGTRERR